jgi:hypothetical protein
VLQAIQPGGEGLPVGGVTALEPALLHA